MESVERQFTRFAAIANMGLRHKAIQGGAFLVARQAIGMALSLVGVLLVTRIIGPGQYGLYAVGAGVVNYLYTFGTWGLDVYLLRKTDDPHGREFDQAFTLLFCISAVFTIGLISLAHIIAGFVKIGGVAPLISVLTIGIPLNLLVLPATVRLDRELNFKQVAMIELIGQISLYAVAVPLAFAGVGAWAPVGGFLTQESVILVLTFWKAKYRPTLLWDTGLIRQMLRYGFGYSSSVWVWQLRTLVNPFIVGRFAGAEAVGFVAVGIRFAEVLSFARAATWRIAMAALAKLNQDPIRLRNSITEGMRLQVLAVGLPLAGFALTAPLLVPLGLGHKWGPALVVFPFIALGALSNAMFNLHSSVLYLLGQNLRVTIFHVCHIILFAGSATLLVPRLGLVGYGWAEVVALFSYIVVHFFLTREVGSPAYRDAAIWFATAACVLAFSSFGPPVMYLGLAVVLLPLLLAKERSSLVGYAQMLRFRIPAS